MNLQEFIEHFEAFVTFIEEAWEQKDLEILKAIISDCKDFIHTKGHQFKCYSADSKTWQKLFDRNRQTRAELSKGMCEWCGEKKGVHCHHLAKRGRLVLYNDVRLLTILCADCHRLFH